MLHYRLQLHPRWKDINIALVLASHEAHVYIQLLVMACRFRLTLAVLLL